MPLNVRDAESVINAFIAGAKANRENPLRRGSIEVVPRDHACRRLIATGDLHDNPLSFARLLELAGLDDAASTETPSANPPAHLTLHELIHPDQLVNDLDLSYRVLARCADLKSRFPERVHVLLANHELAQIVGAGIIKDGVNVVKAFNRGVEYVFPDDAPAIQHALNDFIRSLPLAVRFIGAGSPNADGTPSDLLCAHSLPGPDLWDRFDPTVLERELQDDDLAPRRGSAHIMVWGRNQTPELIESLSQRWGIGTFILGHEKAPEGHLAVSPRAVVLNSDHEHAAFAPIDLCIGWSALAVANACQPLHS